MADVADMIREAEKKLTICNNKIAEVERIKATEAGLRAEASALTIQIDEWKGEQVALEEEAKEEQRAAAAKKAEERAAAEFKKRAAAAPVAPTPPAPKKEEVPKTAEQLKADERNKRIKALAKKLQQIDKLKQKDVSELDPEAKEKMASEPKLLKEMKCLERGEEYVPEPEPVPEVAKVPEPVVAAPVVAAPEPVKSNVMKLPTEPADVEKMKKALRKKLKQIEDLKTKENLDAEATAKVATESKLCQELAALERGDSEVTYKKEGNENADAKNKGKKK